MADRGVTQMLNALSLDGQRKHVVIFSRECLFLSDLLLQQTLIAKLRELASKSNQFELHFTSYGINLQQECLAAATLGIPAGFCIHRNQLREFIRSCWDAGKVVIICGSVNEDMYIAAQTKSFLIAASWGPLEAEVQKYGIPAPTPFKMKVLIEIVANQTSWYYSCTFNRFPPVPIPGLVAAGPVPVQALPVVVPTVPAPLPVVVRTVPAPLPVPVPYVPVPVPTVPHPVHAAPVPVPTVPVPVPTVPVPVPTKVVALCLANYYSGVSNDEEFMARAFKAILKDGDNNPAIKEALFCHLMAAIAHDNDFREVQDWAVAPSSSCSPNQVMEELKERVRCMMYGRKPAPIFIRHTPTSKSRRDNQQARQWDNNYCQKHFTSICVNNAYRGKLKGRVVCVLDDYLNKGNTFEALRNLLVACEVKKIIFVSIGKFKCNNEMHYHQKDFCIQGDVHTPNYTATFNRNLQHDFQCNFNARRSLEVLRTLASYLQ